MSQTILFESDGIQYSILYPEDYEGVRALYFRSRIRTEPTLAYLRKLDPCLTLKDLEKLAEDRYIKSVFNDYEAMSLSIKAVCKKSAQIIGQRGGKIFRKTTRRVVQPRDYHPTINKYLVWASSVEKLYNPYSMFNVDEYGYFISFNVDEAYAGRGIGTKMCELAVQLYKERKIPVITVFASNPAAVTIFEKKLGFQHIGETEVHIEGFRDLAEVPNWTYLALKLDE